MSSVHYLSYSDLPEREGLVFPSELLKDTYSPGIWAVEIQKFKRLPDEFDFDAVDNNELVKLKLVKVDRNVYSVNTDKYGVFFFRIAHIFFLYEKYVGFSQLINKDSRLFQVFSMNVQQLGRTCLEKGFYFVGAIDANLERRSE